MQGKSDDPQRDSNPVVREAARLYRSAAEAEFVLPDAPDRQRRELLEARMAQHRMEADRISKDLPEETRNRLIAYYIRVA